MVWLGRWSTIALLASWLMACGRTPVSPPIDSDRDGGGGDAGVERCNGLDDDGDRAVDEDFRDSVGRYMANAHCGACDRSCDAEIANAAEVACTVIEGLPICAARRCADGFGTTRSGGCAPLDDRLCLPCLDDGDCGTLGSARCGEVAGEQRCTRGCEGGCPDGYTCEGGVWCRPVTGSCRCEDSTREFDVACVLDATADGCPGSARCERGRQSACLPPPERCDGVDNDCDQVIDEAFVDPLGSYSSDPHHCGACGVDCSLDADAGLTLACGGDPFAPSCVTRCPDLDDGIQVGDRLDADRALDNGCECVVSALRDSGGVPSASVGLDADCDGADGTVLSSFYVATSGDDSGPGSPTRPLRTIGVAIARASASLATSAPRQHVYVASGIYTETVRMRDGVQLHGGYRGDFLALDPGGFEVVVVAPADTSAFGGAALVIDGPIRLSTRVEGISLRGRDALGASAPAIGVVISGASGRLSMRDVRVRSGRPGAGPPGLDGDAGRPPTLAAGGGEAPRAAIETDTHICLEDDRNQAIGGHAGRNLCLGEDVSGGAGGTPSCPLSSGTGPSGADGRGSSGSGGLGGDDVTGPISGGTSCPSGVCCGLADFSVPNPFQQAQPGASGVDGSPGALGSGCSDPLGAFAPGAHVVGLAGDGSRGSPGRGGGGGGGGGGARMTWFDGQCEFADGLGGGGGGGGGGGCAGDGGTAGHSGGASVGILIRATVLSELPMFERVEATTSDGAPGGDGGSGGDGAPGGQGGFGGNVPDALRSTPTLAGPMAGERGGKGGDGGGGGGAGGGCGGSAVGIWVSGLGSVSEVIEQMRAGSTFVLGAAGPAGRGGGGWSAADDGAAGRRVEVVVR